MGMQAKTIQKVVMIVMGTQALRIQKSVIDTQAKPVEMMVAHMLTQQLSTHAAQLIYLGAGAGGSPLAAHAHMSAMPTATSIALPTLPEVVIAPEVAVMG